MANVVEISDDEAPSPPPVAPQPRRWTLRRIRSDDDFETPHFGLRRSRASEDLEATQRDSQRRRLASEDFQATQLDSQPLFEATQRVLESQPPASEDPYQSDSARLPVPPAPEAPVPEAPVPEAPDQPRMTPERWHAMSEDEKVAFHQPWGYFDSLQRASYEMHELKLFRPEDPYFFEYVRENLIEAGDAIVPFLVRDRVRTFRFERPRAALVQDGLVLETSPENIRGYKLTIQIDSDTEGGASASSATVSQYHQEANG